MRFTYHDLAELGKGFPPTRGKGSLPPSEDEHWGTLREVVGNMHAHTYATIHPTSGHDEPGRSPLNHLNPKDGNISPKLTSDIACTEISPWINVIR